MKPFMRFALLFATLVVLLAPASSALAEAFNISAGLACVIPPAVVMGLYHLPKPAHLFGLHAAGLQVEIWEKDIVDLLYKDNQFALRSVNADQYVLAGKVVHIPVAGTNASVQKNITSFPQTAVERGDTDITYAIDTLYALPRRIANIDQYELSYDKRMSVIGNDVKQLVQNCMDSLLYNWAPSTANCILTTGALSAADLIDTTATGSRRLFTATEFKTIVKKLKRKDVNGRITALLTAAHYYQFFESLSDGEKTNFGRAADVATGVIGQYMGIDIMMRSSVLRYRVVSTVLTVVDELDPAFAASTIDQAASLFWVESCVEKAEGDTQVFDNPGQALYYGDIWSALKRLGGRIRRTIGVYAVVEATS